MKYIYTWNQDTNMYDIRLATKDEQILIDNATKLLAECKQIHNQIINDANELYHGDLDRFIDDEAYYCVQDLHNKLDLVSKLSKGLIDLNYGKYYFMLW